MATKTYTVVSGDTLSRIGTKTGFRWQDIAKLNNISYPYTIRVGQVLKLPVPVAPTPAPTPTPVPVPTPSPSPTPSPVPSPTPSPSGTTKTFAQRKFGSYVEDSSGGTLWDLAPLTTMETKLGRKLDIVSGFCQAGDLSDLSSNMKKVISGGREVMLSYDVQYNFANIISGNYDSTFTKDANAAKTVGGTVYLRLWAEMNGNWSPWSVGQGNVSSTSQWIQAWKHIVDLYRKAGATNVKFVWCPNVTDEGSYKLEQYWPGTEWVDLNGFDGYNWGGSDWQSHTKVYQTIYNRLVAVDSTKDILIGETSSAEGSSGQKGAWVTALLKDTSFPKIIGIVFFSVDKERNWRLDSSPESLNAFKTGLSS